MSKPVRVRGPTYDNVIGERPGIADGSSSAVAGVDAAAGPSPWVLLTRCAAFEQDRTWRD